MHPTRCIIQIFLSNIGSPQLSNSKSCPKPNWIQDGTCDEREIDSVFQMDICLYDGGDCCKNNLIGNGVCDEVNNFKSCGNFDGGDCQVSEHYDESIKDSNITKPRTNDGSISYPKFTPLSEIIRQQTTGMCMIIFKTIKNTLKPRYSEHVCQTLFVPCIE